MWSRLAVKWHCDAGFEKRWRADRIRYDMSRFGRDAKNKVALQSEGAVGRRPTGNQVSCTTSLHDGITLRLNTHLHTFGHRRNKLMAIGMRGDRLHARIGEVVKRTAFLLDLSKPVLSPWPNIFLRIQIGRIERLVRQHLDTRLRQRPLRDRRAEDLLAI